MQLIMQQNQDVINEVREKEYDEDMEDPLDTTETFVFSQDSWTNDG